MSATLTPAAASSRDVASPMPLDAPVMNATLPSNSIGHLSIRYAFEIVILWLFIFFTGKTRIRQKEFRNRVHLRFDLTAIPAQARTQAAKDQGGQLAWVCHRYASKICLSYYALNDEVNKLTSSLCVPHISDQGKIGKMTITQNTTKHLILIIAVLLTVAVGIRFIHGLTKKTFHVDEGITIGLTNGTWLPAINTPHTNKWLNQKDVSAMVFDEALMSKDYLDLSQLSKSTAMDVHPPLYYFFYTSFRLIFGIQNHALAGVMQNILFFLISSLCLVSLLRRLSADPFIVIFGLICFAFSSAAISVTTFLRMYEMLMTCCIGFFYFACNILFPADAKNKVFLTLHFAGLFACTVCGFLTHYYFLFFLLPAGIFCFIYLAVKRRIFSLFFGLLSVAAALLLSSAVFPAAIHHLTQSYRASESIGNLAQRSCTLRLSYFLTYLGILSKNLISLVFWIGAGITGLVFLIRAILKKTKVTLENNPPAHSPIPVLPFFICTLFISIFTISIISFSAPYQTLRYVAGFLPLYVLAFVSFTLLILGTKRATLFIAAAALLSTAYGVLPSNLNYFNEDYTLDKDPYYLHDKIPVIIMATNDCHSWKNMLIYKNMGLDKQVYYIMEEHTASVDNAVKRIAALHGGKYFHIILDDYFRNKPAYPLKGKYGFFDVYTIALH